MTTYDVLVLGGGIAGMESARRLADGGLKVVLVEKEASIGGRVPGLSRVFPTLESAASVAGPLLSSVAQHPNVTTMTLSEIAGASTTADGGHRVSIRRKPRYIDTDACKACGDCAKACTVTVPDPFNYGLTDRRAAHIPFPGAVPNKTLLQREGTSPCTYACPAGIKSHAYVSLVRSGQYEKAFTVVLEATPLAGSLGRACFAFCEAQCTHAEVDRSIPIRRLKRFIADSHYASGEGPAVRMSKPTDKRVAVVGSGPAGITAAFRLACKGHKVKVFEAAPVAGGLMRLAIPSYRLPIEVVEADVANVTALGVEIAVDSPVEDLEALRADGFDAVLIATGTSRSNELDVPGASLAGSMPALAFMRAAKTGTAPELRGRRVVVVGGGNVAMDTARTAVRLGAASTTVVYRRGRAEMPARLGEVEDAEREGVAFSFLAAPVGIADDGRGNVAGLRCVRTVLGEPDASGRRRPEPVRGSEFEVPCDAILPAIGLRPDEEAFGGFAESTPGGMLAADPVTLQTAVPWLFAAGDVVSGPSNITAASGQGRRAAHMIDRMLTGRPLGGFDLDGGLLPVADKAAVMARRSSHEPGFRPAAGLVADAAPGFEEIEGPLTEIDARLAASDCLDCAVCCECYECMHVCPNWAIKMNQREQIEEVEVGAMVVATGRGLAVSAPGLDERPPRHGNVITAAQLERMLAADGPFGAPIRPVDGRAPARIAYVLGRGAAGETSDGAGASFVRSNAIKQCRLIAETLPGAGVTVCVEPGIWAGGTLEEFRQDLRLSGAECVAARAEIVSDATGGEAVLRLANDGGLAGASTDSTYDLVVLAVGLQPGGSADLPVQGDGPGTFVAGTAAGTMDIAATLADARDVATRAAAYLLGRVSPA